MVSLSLKSGTITLILSAVVAGLDYIVQNSPQYAADAGFAVAVILAFLTFESQQPATK